MTPPVSTTPAANFSISFASVVDTGGKFAIVVKATGGKFAIVVNATGGGVNDVGGKFATRINNTGGK
jgi:hypothetical protein